MKTTSPHSALQVQEFLKNHANHKIEVKITTFDDGSESNSELGQRSCTFEADLKAQELTDILNLVVGTFEEE